MVRLVDVGRMSLGVFYVVGEMDADREREPGRWPLEIRLAPPLSRRTAGFGFPLPLSSPRADLRSCRRLKKRGAPPSFMIRLGSFSWSVDDCTIISCQPTTDANGVVRAGSSSPPSSSWPPFARPWLSSFCSSRSI